MAAGTRCLRTAVLVVTGVLSGLGNTYIADASAPVSCHCFTDRSFDPQRRFAADDYLLTTTFNSLIARHYSIPKRQIVMMKMNGTDPGDLLVGLHIARATGGSLETLLGARNGGRPWGPALLSAGIDPGHMEPEFQRLSAAGGDPKTLVEYVADLMIVRELGATRENLAITEQQGGSMKERALDALLARHTGRPQGSFFRETKDAGKSWGEILAGLGLDGDSVGALIGEKGGAGDP